MKCNRIPQRTFTFEAETFNLELVVTEDGARIAREQAAARQAESARKQAEAESPSLFPDH